MLRFLFDFLMACHGIAHLPGFLVAWRIKDLPELPYSTVVLAGKIDVGAGGIRILGLAWLLAAIALVVSGVAATWRVDWWYKASLVALSYSSLICMVGLPASRYGLAVNALLFGFAVIAVSRSWFS